MSIDLLSQVESPKNDSSQIDLSLSTLYRSFYLTH